MEAKVPSSGVTDIAGSPATNSTPALAIKVGQKSLATALSKKRGRPRKYGPNGSIIPVLSPMPMGSTPPAVTDFSAQKRPMLKPAVSVPNNHQPKFEAENLGNWSSSPFGAKFTLHTIIVNAQEDITMKLISFSRQCHRAICILSATGVISSATLRQLDDPFGGLLTYEDRYEILSLTGSLVPRESGGILNRSGAMSITFARGDGSVIGGGVGGLLIAASPVQIVVGSFLVEDEHEQEPKKQKTAVINNKAPASGENLSMHGSPYGNDPYHED